MWFRSALVCGRFFLGARTRCCTTWRGTATELKLPADFKSMGSIRVFANYLLGRDSGRVQISPCQLLGFGGGDRFVVGVPVGAEIIEPILLGQPVHPVFLRNFLPRQPLAEPRSHGVEFRQRRAA